MANTKVLIKRSSANTAPTSLLAGELAFSYASNTLFIGSSDGSQVLSVSELASQSAFNQANTATNNAASASAYANTGIDLAQAAFEVANGAASGSTDQYARNAANSAGIYANTAIDNAASASLYANTGIDLAQAAYDTANGVQFSLSADSGSGTVANNGTLTITGGQGITSNVSDSTVTLDVDNTVVRSNTSDIGTQTINTNLTIGSNKDLTVTGNLIINGNITSQNVQSLEVADPLILLGVGNYVSDTKDIGFAAHYNDGSNAHTGLIRDAVTKEYHFFQGYTGELDANNNIDINDASYREANVHASYFKGNLIADTAVVAGLDITSYIQIDGVNVLPYINAAFDKANTANVLAQNAYDQANTATNNAASASSYANTAIDNAASASLYANNAINDAASASAYANTGINNAASASQYANDAITIAQAAYGQANTATNDAASASLYANNAINDAASASLYANTGINNAASASLYANNAINDAASASAYANTGITIAGAAFDQANAANSLAQSAFNAANNVVSSFNIAADSGTTDTFSTGETLTLTGGDGVSTTVANNQVTFDVDNTVIRTTGGQTINGSLAITGDLVVSGNTITQDVSTLVVEDSLIELAANNSVADTLDIGFFGQYANDGTKYTTLMRDATDGKYKLLVNGTEKPSAANTVNVASFSTGTLVANVEATSITTSTLTATGLSYLASPGSTDGIVYVDSAGVIKYSFTVDGGTF
jgi:hypothetical protein